MALTHRSYAYEHGAIPHNERLEFLGDSVLGQGRHRHAVHTHPDLEEGELAKRRASVVSTVASPKSPAGSISAVIFCSDAVRSRRAVRDKDSILADTMEAVIGATYLSAGPEAATELVCCV